MQCGPAGPGQREVTATIPPGAAYIIAGVAQGRTNVCEMHRVAHAMCNCCWTHGVWNEGSSLTRESITLRVFDTEWGREIVLNAVEVVEADEAADGADASDADANASALPDGWVVENVTPVAALSGAAGGADHEEVAEVALAAAVAVEDDE